MFTFEFGKLKCLRPVLFSGNAGRMSRSPVPFDHSDHQYACKSPVMEVRYPFKLDFHPTFRVSF